MPRNKQKPEPSTNGLEPLVQRRRFIFEKITTAMRELNQREVIHWHLESPEIYAQQDRFSDAISNYIAGSGTVEQVRDEYKKYVDLHRPERTLV